MVEMLLILVLIALALAVPFYLVSKRDRGRDLEPGSRNVQSSGGDLGSGGGF